MFRSGGSGASGRGQCLCDAVYHSVAVLIRQDALYKRVSSGHSAVHAYASRDCHGGAGDTREDLHAGREGSGSTGPAAPPPNVQPSPRSHGVGSSGRPSTRGPDGRRPAGTFDAGLAASKTSGIRRDVRDRIRNAVPRQTESMQTHFAAARSAVQRGAMSVDDLGVSTDRLSRTFRVGSEQPGGDGYTVVLSQNCRCTCKHFVRGAKKLGDALCKHICAVTNQRLHEPENSVISCNLHALKPAEVAVLMGMRFLDPPVAAGGETYVVEEVLLEDAGGGRNGGGSPDGSSRFLLRWKGYKGADWVEERDMPEGMVENFRTAGKFRGMAGRGGGGGGGGGRGGLGGGGCSGAAAATGNAHGTGKDRPAAGGGVADGRKRPGSSKVLPCTTKETMLANLGQYGWGIALSAGTALKCKAHKRDPAKAAGHTCKAGTAKGHCILVAKGYVLGWGSPIPETELLTFCAAFEEGANGEVSFKCPANFLSAMHKVHKKRRENDIHRIEDAPSLTVCDGVVDDADETELRELMVALKRCFKKKIYSTCGFEFLADGT